MPKLKMAGLCLDIRRENPILNRQIADYLAEGEPDIVVDFGQEYIEREIEEEIRSNLDFPPAYSEYLAIYRYICTEITRFNGFLIHGSALAIDGKAYLFCAPSGTGKSTHARLWREAFGERVTMINDDKPILRQKDGVFYACGTPWSGKHDLDTNVEVPLAGLVILSRGQENRMEEVAPASVLGLLFNQIFRPSDNEKYLATIDLVSALLDTCPVYRLYCNLSPEAALTAYQTLNQNQPTA